MTQLTRRDFLRLCGASSIGLALAACGVTPTPIAMPAPTNTALPSSTPLPTATETLTNTPAPTSTATTTATVSPTQTPAPTATATRIPSLLEIMGTPPTISWRSPTNVDKFDENVTWKSIGVWKAMNKQNGHLEQLPSYPGFDTPVFVFYADKDIDSTTGELRIYPSFYTKERMKGVFSARISFLISQRFNKSRAVILSLFNSIPEIPDTRAPNKQGDWSVFVNVNITTDGYYQISSVAPFSQDELKVTSRERAVPGLKHDIELRFDGKDTLELFVDGKAIQSTRLHPKLLLPENADLRSIIGGHAGGYVYDTWKGEYVVNGIWEIDFWQK